MQRITSSQIDQKIVNAESAKKLLVPSLVVNHDTKSRKSPLVSSSTKEAYNTESTMHIKAQLGQKVKDAETIKEQTLHSSHIVRLIAKARDANAFTLSFQI